MRAGQPVHSLGPQTGIGEGLSSGAYCVPGAEWGHLHSSLFSRGSDLSWATRLGSADLCLKSSLQCPSHSEGFPEEVCLLGVNVNRCEAGKHWAGRRGREFPWGVLWARLECGAGPLHTSPRCSWLLCRLLRPLSRDKTGIIDIIKYRSGPRRLAWWAGPPFPATLSCYAGPALLLGPATGPPLGGMQAGSRPRDPGKETLVLGPGGLPPTLPRLQVGRGEGAELGACP